MRLTTSQRLTLSNAAVIMACYVLLTVFVMWLSQHFMLRHIEESVSSELSLLAGEHHVENDWGLTLLVRQRLASPSAGHERYYRVENARGEVLASNLGQWLPGVVPNGELARLDSLSRPGRSHLVAAAQQFDNGTRLLVALDESELRKTQHELREGALWGLLVVLLLSLPAGYLITRRALQPIQTLREAAETIMAGNWSHRLPDAGDHDEFAQLAGTLNAMLDRIDNLIAGIQGATDNIAHDLRSPLTRLRARLAGAQGTPPAAAEWSTWVGEHLGDLDQVLATFQSLLRIARVDSGVLRQEFVSVDASELCRDAVEFMEPLAEEAGQLLTVSLPDSILVTGHRDLLFQLLINLLDNAIKYSPPHTPIHVDLFETAEYWQISVSDQGPGIPEPERERVLERLYRLDATRNTPGLGLGLSLVAAVTRLHRGELTLSAGTSGRGLKVGVRCPRSA
ncbi:ATP-binding protein [Perlucidibaca piscinae]|uniref:ATP-binding protein n=1 Tax=Perlucidibaca piscinae TaxID=392589 RepID=UPI0003B40855|nr:ATP-binding protein [Perlucidibaca piscinae]